tara:strand:- start:2788 stop:3942 length:1155 start_codon:yes stop_codon:yes gene_type:complete
MHDAEIPIGPQSPIMKEPICIRINLDGNKIKDSWIKMGYIHRGMEKLLETKNINQALYTVEHICGICSFAHSGCFTLAFEKLLDFKKQDNVKFIRMIIAELERIHSHLLWFGYAMHEIGFETLFNYAMREREYILECFEKLTGNRVHHGISKLKTVRYNINFKDKEFVMERLKKIQDQMDFYIKTTINNKIILSRFENNGLINRNLAQRFCLVGPTARASGIKMDVRKDEPYEAYDSVDFNLITEKNGDALARTLVRLREILESIKIIKQCFHRLNDKPIPKFEKDFQLKDSETYARIEAPRGENFHFYKIKDNKILRAKIRTPTFAFISVLTQLLKDKEIGDVPVIVSSLDPCFGCMERMIVVKDNKKEVLKEDEFRSRYCKT